MAIYPGAAATDTNLYLAVNYPVNQTTLNGGINNSVTTITLTSTAFLPTAGGFVTIDTELIQYASVISNTITGCTRGVGGTTAASHLTGVPVVATVVAEHHNANIAEIEAIETDLVAAYGQVAGATNINTALQTIETQISGKLGTTLTSAHIFVGNGSNVATSVSLSGDATLSNAGALTLATVNSNVGSFTLASITVNAKGLITAASSGGSGFVSSITGTAHQVIASASTGAVTLSTPQNIDTNSTPTFANLTLSNTTNQLVLGTTNTVTLSSTAPSASRTYTIPDAGAAANVVLDAGNYTIGGTWTFNNSITLASSKALILTDNTTHTVTVKATNSTTSYTLSLPTTAGTNGYVLQTDGSGNTSWVTQTSGTGTVTSVAMTVPSFLSVSGSPITTSGTLAVTLSGTALPVANGGTGDTTLTAHNVLLGEGTSAIAFAAPGASGQFLISQGSSSDPAFEAMSGDATLASTGALTLATVNTNTGSFGSSTAIPNFTVNGKGLITAAGTNVVIAPAGTLTGTTLASNVVTSSLTTVGTIGTGTWQGTAITVTYGGTGDASFTTYAPICGGTTTTGALQSASTGMSNSGYVLTSNGSSSLPTWQAATGGANTALSNLASVAINLSLLPGSDNSIDLGSTTKSWRNEYITGKIEWNPSSVDTALTRNSAGVLEIDNGTSGDWGSLFLGNEKHIPLLAPATLTVTPTGSTGASTWQYAVLSVAPDGTFSTVQTGVTSTGVTPLTGSNYNALSWSSVTGATTYKVYRYVSAGTPSTLGLIGTTASTTLNDTGLAGDGTPAPLFDRTGTVSFDNGSGTIDSAIIRTGPGNLGITNGVAQVSGAYAYATYGNLTTSVLNTISIPTPAAPTITQHGSAGSTHYTYAVAALDAFGNITAASTGTVTTAGNATLTSSNYNIVTWTMPLATWGAGIASYNVYRTASSGTPSSTGLIGNTTALTFNDTGLTGTGSAPAINNTGLILLQNGSGGGQVKIAPLESSSSTYTLTLPTNKPGTAGSTITSDTSGNLSFTATLPIANGGTGLTTFTAHNVLLGEGTSTFGFAAPGTTGYPLLSQGASSDPSFAQLSLTAGVTGTLPVGNGGTGVANPTAHYVLIGAGSSALILVSPGSTTGVPLISNGASSDPSFGQLNLASSSAVTGTLAIGNGGTGVASVTTSPTASAWAGWDANKNLSANNHIEGYRTTATAAGTTTLVVGDAYLQYFTGSTTQTVVMPATSTLVLGQQYLIVNTSSGVVTVQSSGTNTIQAMAANTQLILTVILTSGTGTASWSWEYSPLGTTPVALGGTGDTSLTAYAVLCGGTTSTGAIQSVSGVGSSNQVLTSNGASALPTWQNAAGGPVATINLTNQSANIADTLLYATPNDSTVHVYRITFVNTVTTAGTSGNLVASITFTDENGNTHTDFVGSTASNTQNAVGGQSSGNNFNNSHSYTDAINSTQDFATGSIALAVNPNSTIYYNINGINTAGSLKYSTRWMVEKLI